MELSEIILLIVIIGPIYFLAIWKVYYQNKHKKLYYHLSKEFPYLMRLKWKQRNVVGPVFLIGVCILIIIKSSNFNIDIAALILLALAATLLYQFISYR